MGLSQQVIAFHPKTLGKRVLSKSILYKYNSISIILCANIIIHEHSLKHNNLSVSVLQSGYASTGSGTGVYSPVKLDLGGLLLGTVVGLGAVLLIPKLLHIFSYGNNGYSSYGRSKYSEIMFLITAKECGFRNI